MFTVYILHSESVARYYVGHTNDIDRRLREHNDGASKWTRCGAPWSLVHSERFDTRAEAVAREREIKAWKSRKKIDDLVVTAQDQ